MTYEHLTTSCKTHQSGGWLGLYATLLIPQIYVVEKDLINFNQSSFIPTTDVAQQIDQAFTVIHFSAPLLVGGFE